ncbi:MAG: threonine-phosphate decarboxylase [Bacillota bacterium]
MSKTFADETGGHGGDLERAALRWGKNKEELLDFSSNVNPLGPPPGLIDHLGDVLPAIVNYPTPQARRLRKELARFLKLPQERLLLGNGANELIHLLLLWHRPRRVLIPAPTFSEYERAAVLAGSSVERYFLAPANNLDLNWFENNLRCGDLLVLCNPNNPTGTLYPRSDLMALVGKAGEYGVDVMVDESFIPLTGKPQESLRDLQKNNLWIILSLTKLWCLPGLRLGCLIGPEGIIRELTRWGDPWRVNILAQEAGLFCLNQENYLKESLDLIESERRYLCKKFMATGFFQVFEGAANYLLIKGRLPGFNVAEFQDFLAGEGLFIRRADNFYGLDRRYFRVAVRRREENKKLIRAVEKYLEHWQNSNNYKQAIHREYSGGEGQ